MKKVTNCMDCKYSKCMAGIDSRLTKLMRIESHPYPTQTCTKYGITRERRQYDMRRLPMCIKENGGEWRE